MRRTAGTRKSKVETYIEVRIETLREERNKTNNENTHLILDKGIIELTYVLELTKRENQSDE
ncbi:MAG: hypothetical protein ACI89A_000240 [Porticoccaceae bacterium]|jgi:hypothetical protein